MATFKAGNFAKSTSTGVQNVTGLGFTPEVIFFFTSGQANFDTAAAFSPLSMGFMDSNLNQFVMSDNDADDVDPTRCDRSFRTDHCIQDWNGSSYAWSASAGAVNSDGFDIYWDNADAFTGQQVYVAMSGLTNYVVGTDTSGTATGDYSYTTVGFQPDVVFFVGGNNDTSEGAATSALKSLGWATGSGSEAMLETVSVDGQGTSACDRQQAGGLCYAKATVNQADSENASFKSLDANGYTLNFKTDDGSARKFGRTALAGLRAKASSFVMSTSTGAQSVTGIGFQPELLMFIWQGDTADQWSIHSRFLIGAATAADQEYARHSAGADGAARSDTNRRITNDSCLLRSGVTGTPAVLDEANLTSLDADGFSINWSTNAATASKIHYLALASQTAGAAAAVVVDQSFAMVT